MTFALTLLSPLQPVVATLLSPSSICSVYSLSATILIAFAWLAWRRKRRDRPVVLRALARAIFSRRVLRHRSSTTDHSRLQKTENGLMQITTDEVVEEALELLRDRVR